MFYAIAFCFFFNHSLLKTETVMATICLFSMLFILCFCCHSMSFFSFMSIEQVGNKKCFTVCFCLFLLDVCRCESSVLSLIFPTIFNLVFLVITRKAHSSFWCLFFCSKQTARTTFSTFGQTNVEWKKKILIGEFLSFFHTRVDRKSVTITKSCDIFLFQNRICSTLKSIFPCSQLCFTIQYYRHLRYFQCKYIDNRNRDEETHY